MDDMQVSHNTEEWGDIHSKYDRKLWSGNSSKCDLNTFAFRELISQQIFQQQIGLSELYSNYPPVAANHLWWSKIWNALLDNVFSPSFTESFLHHLQTLFRDSSAVNILVDLTIVSIILAHYNNTLVVLIDMNWQTDIQMRCPKV